MASRSHPAQLVEVTNSEGEGVSIVAEAEQGSAKSCE